jgi:hypothetical protein
MLVSAGFQALLADCRDKAEKMSWTVVHTLPTTPEAHVEQSFFRGKITAYEDFLGIAEDLKTFLEAQKETP